MNVWLVEISDFVPWIDRGQRPFRCGMLAEALAHSGHVVNWWTSTFNHQLRLARFPTSRTVRVAPNVDIHLLFGPGYGNSRSITRWRHNRAVAAEFRRYARAQRTLSAPDLIYACLPTLEVGEQAADFAKILQVPLVVDVRDLLPDNYLTLFPAWTRAAVKKALTLEYRRVHRVFGRASAIIASSEAYLRWGLAYARRTQTHLDKVFPLGAPDLRARGGHAAPTVEPPAKNPERLTVTFAGTFSRLFDFETIIEAARELQTAGDRVVFRLAGTGPRLDHVRAMCKDLRNIEFCGWLDQDELRQELSASDIGLAPYTSLIPPTLPNKPFEYMSMGLPVLTCAEGELRTLVATERIGVHYTFGSAQELTVQLRALARNRHELREMGVRARSIYEKRFDQNVVYSELVNHLQCVAHAARSDAPGAALPDPSSSSVHVS
jgi:glycosyltransferase involved in cell wall biosynthesis